MRSHRAGCSKNHLLTITGARLGLSRLRDGLGACFARVSIADRRRHGRARSVGLHALGRTRRGRAASRSRCHRLWPALAAPAPVVVRFQRRRRHQRGSRRLRRFAPACRLRRAGAGCLCRACAGSLRRVLSSRCRRQAARRGLWPGRPHQYLRDRCRRLDHHAADRLGAGARPHAGRSRRRNRRQPAQRLYPRPFGGGRDRSLSAVLHPG